MNIRGFAWCDLEQVAKLMADLGYPTEVSGMKQRMQAMEADPTGLLTQSSDGLTGEGYKAFLEWKTRAQSDGSRI